MPSTFTRLLAENLNKKCTHNVVEASDNTTIAQNTIYIAPGGQHMFIKRNELREPVIGLNDNAPENNSKPSIDVLFRSVADVYSAYSIALVMTGMGNDGSKSLNALKRAGATILAQDKDSSVVWGMPENAIKTGCVDHIVSLNDLPKLLKQIIDK